MTTDHNKAIDKYYEDKAERSKKEWAKLCQLRRDGADIKEINKQERIVEYTFGYVGD